MKMTSKPSNMRRKHEGPKCDGIVNMTTKTTNPKCDDIMKMRPKTSTNDDDDEDEKLFTAEPPPTRIEFQGVHKGVGRFKTRLRYDVYRRYVHFGDRLTMSFN